MQQALLVAASASSQSDPILCAQGLATGLRSFILYSLPFIPKARDTGLVAGEHREEWDVSLKRLSLAHPAIFNTVIPFVFGLSSKEELEERRERMGHCKCDISVHSFAHKPSDGTSSEESSWSLFGGCLFRFATVLLKGTPGTTQFNRLSNSGYTGRRDEGYRQIVHFFQQDPSSLISSACWWYKSVRSGGEVLDFLTTFGDRYRSAFDAGLGSICPTLGCLIIDHLNDVLTTTIEKNELSKGPGDLDFTPVSNILSHCEFLSFVSRMSKRCGAVF